ncbi:MAG: hypothetical protein P8179_09915 [Candidatus Thiodiazotropha sp.]
MKCLQAFKYELQPNGEQIRAISHKTTFSNNWKKAKTKVQKLHIRIVHVCKESLHRATSIISQNHTPAAGTHRSGSDADQCRV